MLRRPLAIRYRVTWIDIDVRTTYHKYIPRGSATYRKSSVYIDSVSRSMRCVGRGDAFHKYYTSRHPVRHACRIPSYANNIVRPKGADTQCVSLRPSGQPQRGPVCRLQVLSLQVLSLHVLSQSWLPSHASIDHRPEEATSTAPTAITANDRSSTSQLLRSVTKDAKTYNAFTDDIRYGLRLCLHFCKLGVNKFWRAHFWV